MERHLIPSLGALLMLTALGCAQPQVATRALAPGKYPEKIKVGSLQRTYTLHVPPQATTQRPLPLVILLHGFTSNGAAIERETQFPATAAKQGFLLATPEGIGQPTGWNVGFIDLSGKRQDDAAFLNQLIDDVVRKTRVDPKRIYLAGHSNGAMLAFYAGSRLSNRLAAVAGFAGVIGLNDQNRIPDLKSPLSAMMIHAIKDPTVAYNVGSSALMQGLGAEAGATWWAKAIGATATSVALPSQDPSVIIRGFQGGRNRTEVVFVTLRNGNHAWTSGKPGFDATDAIWRFFWTHPRQ